MEKRLEDETELLNTPYLRRIRAEGALEVRRRCIVETVALRFAPPLEVLQQMRQLLEARSEDAALAQLFTAVIRSTSLAEFQEALAQV